MNPNDRIYTIPALPNQNGLANVPGIRKLWLIETRYVMGLVDPRTVAGALDNGWQLTDTGLQIAEDAVINSFTFPSDRASYEQRAGNNIHGVAYSQTLTLEVPRDHALVALAAQRMSGRKFVAIYQDLNGARKLIGTPKQPLRFLAGSKVTPNQYAFSWSGQTRQPAFFFTDNALLDYRPDSDFSYGFSDEFY